MLHGTRRVGGELLSFERSFATRGDREGNPRREEVMTREGHRCTICDRLGHPEVLCPIPLDPRPPGSGPIGVIGQQPPKCTPPAVPLEDYRGPGRVIVVPRGLSGEDLQRERIGRIASTSHQRRKLWAAGKGTYSSTGK